MTISRREAIQLAAAAVPAGRLAMAQAKMDGIRFEKGLVPSLATDGPASPAKILNVELLGAKGKLQWTQDATALRVQLPAQKPCRHAVTLKTASA